MDFKIELIFIKFTFPKDLVVASWALENNNKVHLISYAPSRCHVLLSILNGSWEVFLKQRLL